MVKFSKVGRDKHRVVKLTKDRVFLAGGLIVPRRIISNREGIKRGDMVVETLKRGKIKSALSATYRKEGR